MTSTTTSSAAAPAPAVVEPGPSWAVANFVRAGLKGRRPHRVSQAAAAALAQRVIVFLEEGRNALHDLEAGPYYAPRDPSEALDPDEQREADDLRAALALGIAVVVLLRRRAGHHGNPAAVTLAAYTDEQQRAHLAALEARRAADVLVILAAVLVVLTALEHTQAAAATTYGSREPDHAPPRTIDASRVLPDRAPPARRAVI